MDEELVEAVEKLKKKNFTLSFKGDVQVMVDERTMLVFRTDGKMIRLIGNNLQVLETPEMIKEYLN